MHERLTTTKATAAATSVHLSGSTVATSKPRPKKMADLILCLRHFIPSPFIIIYARQKCVLEKSADIGYNQIGGEKMRTLTIGKNDAGQRLDKFLQKRFKTMPKPMLTARTVVQT